MSPRKGMMAGIALAAALATAAPSAAEAQSTGGNRAAQATVGNLISALNNISVQVDRLSALNNLTVQDVRVVDVDDVLNDANVQAFNNALNRNLNNNTVQILNNAINNNEIIKNVLNNADISVSRVVAIDVLSGGDVIVFYQ